MPIHNGLIPREGFNSDLVLKLFGRTAMNPLLLLPAYLLAKYTKKGEDFTMLHPTAFSRFKTLFYLALARYLSMKLSDGVTNNWTSDRYSWPQEVAVVTGGADGLGGHVARLLAERKINVVVLDIQPLTYEAGPNIHYFRCDVASAASLAEVAKEIRAKVGEPTILVNNAGVVRGKTILDSTENDFRFTFDVNAFAHYNTVKEFLPSMVKKNHGMVVTVSSYAVWIPTPHVVDYAMSKAASHAFHEGLSAELRTVYNAPKVRTVLVHPGHMKTQFANGAHFGTSFTNPVLEPESAADAVCRQIFSGRSGHVVTPAIGRVLQLMQALPHWLSYSLMAGRQSIMTTWKGRQVVEDLDRYYAERAKTSNPEESTVIVPNN